MTETSANFIEGLVKDAEAKGAVGTVLKTLKTLNSGIHKTAKPGDLALRVLAAHGSAWPHMAAHAHMQGPHS